MLYKKNRIIRDPGTVLVVSVVSAAGAGLMIGIIGALVVGGIALLLHSSITGKPFGHILG